MDDVYYSPSDPTIGLDAYRRESPCRQPGTRMLGAALTHWPHRRNGSCLIDDQRHDIEAARWLGIDWYHFGGGNLRAFVEEILDGRINPGVLTKGVK